MTISRAQMYRQLYQVGGMSGMGIESLSPMQPAMQPAMQSAMYSPLQNNYSEMPMMMAGGGRMGYQEGDIAMSQPEGIMGAMPGAMQPEAGGMMQGQMMQPPMQDQMQPNQEQQTAILTIVQLLIEQGIDPETARELAIQILQAFAQGGEPAVEAFANQLEQEEMQQEEMQQPMMMAGGGLTSIDRARDMLQSRAPRGEFLAYINPQEAGILRLMGGAGQDVNVRGVPSYFKKFFKSAVKAVSSVVKSVANVVKDVAKSPIGMIALSVAAPYALGALTGGAFTTFGNAALGQIGGAALRAGISNLAIQGITTGKFNPKQALLAAAAGGALSGLTGPASAATNIDTSTGLPVDSITGTSSLTSGVTPTASIETGSQFASATPIETGSQFASAVGPGPGIQAGSIQPYTAPTIGDRFTQGIDYLKSTGTKLMSDPIGTIGTGIKATYDLAKKYPAEAILAATAALGALTPQQPNEPDSSYEQRKAEYDNRVAQYITQYGGAAKVYSPGPTGLYAMEGAVDPFAGKSSYLADGGSISFERKSLERKGYGDMMKNMTPKEISQLYDSVMGTFSRRFQAEGSMPMGEPRRNPAGIMELDYRAKGGFVPPIGIKEKADDIPAMLSNNEFVFTANAVRNAGGGNVNKGAERMYGLMKQLEAGGVV